MGLGAWVEASLGPNAKLALETMLSHTTWDGLRAKLLHGPDRRNVAIGYRFQIPSRWSEPEETLDDRNELSGEFGIEVGFKNRFGDYCQTYYIKFVEAKATVGLGRLSYLVDNSDIADVLRVVAACD